MISNCPHCQGDLKFSTGQTAQIAKALAALKPGKRLTLKCPRCQKAMHLDSTGNVAASAEKARTEKVEIGIADSTIKAPQPPDLSWLKDGHMPTEEKVRDVPMALVLHPDEEAIAKVKAAMETLGYRAMTAATAEEAMEQTRSINFATIVLHVDFEGGGLENSTFHKYMRNMVMAKRRYVFYILFGAQFHSLYDLEALANSANLVVAEQDLDFFDIILHKAIPAYEALFGPFLEEVGNYGA